MKKLIYITITLLFLGLQGCADFEEMNTDPTTSTDLDPNLQLTTVIVERFSVPKGFRCSMSYLSAFTQTLAGAWEIGYYGGRYRQDDACGPKEDWDAFYGTCAKNSADLIYRTKDDERYASIHAIARIFNVFQYSYLTDVWGDVPYFEAGKGYIDGTIRPKYDKQEDIYTDFFKELDEAIVELDNTTSLPVTGDPLFQGDLTKWKKLANSLMLRFGMRVIKVNPELAKEEVTKAIAGGVMTSRDEEALIKMYNSPDDSDDRINYLAVTLNGYAGTESGVTPCATLMIYMRDTQDPRFFKYGRAYAWSDHVYHSENGDVTINDGDDITDLLIKYSSPSTNQYCWGLIDHNGYNWSQKHDSDDLHTGATSLIPWGTIEPSIGWQEPVLLINHKLRAHDMPAVIMPYAETQFLLAEAKYRWPDLAINNTVSELYESGLREANYILRKYDIDVTDQEVEDFVAANPLESGKELEQINMQMWVLNLLNLPESFNNWRRSGYPANLVFGPGPADPLVGGTSSIPRRLFYPTFEQVDNAENFQEAIDRMGGKDDWESRVWWDVEN